MLKQQIEEVILAECLTSKALAREACDLLVPEDFSNDTQNADIFRAIQSAVNSELGINRASLAIEFERLTIDSSRLANLLQHHQAKPAHEDEVKYLFTYLRELNERGKISSFARELSFQSEDSSCSMTELRQKIITAADIITPLSLRSGNSLSVIGDEYRKSFTEPANTVLSGFLDLDRITNGFPKKEMSVLVGGTGMGKTSMSLAIAYQVARMGIPVAYYCFEMASEKMYEKVLAHHGNIPYFILERRPPDEIERWKDTITASSMELDALPLYMFDERITPDLLRLEESIRYRANKNGVQLVIIDYLQKVPISGNLEENSRIGRVSERLTYLAKSCNLAVLGLTQPNYAAERRDDGLPKITDLHYGGQIGKDAANIFYIIRRKYGKEFVDFAMRNKFMIPFHETKLYYMKGRFGQTPQMIGGIAYIPNYSKYVNVQWDESRYEPLGCPNCGHKLVRYNKGRIYCPDCNLDQPAIDRQAKSGLVFQTQAAKIYGKEFMYDFAYLKQGNYQSDNIIKQIGQLNLRIKTEDNEPIRRIAIHSGDGLHPIVVANSEEGIDDPNV